MTGKRIATVALGLLCLLGLTACGGGDSGDSKAEVVTKANEICSQAEQQSRAYTEDHDQPQSPEQVNAALAEDARITKQVADKLDELDPPEDGKENFDTFVASQQKSAALYDQQVNASKTGDDKEFLNSSEQLLDKTDDAKKSAEAYGLTDCPYSTVAAFYGGQSEDGGGGSDTSADTGAEATIGRWIGRVTQYGPGDKTYRYTVHMNVNQMQQGAIAGTIRYPSFPCSGQLQLQRQSGDRSVFRERITSNIKECTAGGTIVTTANGDRLSWRWVGKNEAKSVEVLGSLQRRD